VKAEPNSIEAARDAKDEARRRFAGRPGVVGIGLTRRGGCYAIKVNLAGDSHAELPAEVQGVPVVAEVVGAIRRR
jgi:hypothetical protein